MQRTVAGMVLLAALGGCTSATQGPDTVKRIVYDGRQPLPPAASPAWGQFQPAPTADSYTAAAQPARPSSPAGVAATGQPRTSFSPAPVAQPAKPPGMLPASLPETSPNVPAAPLPTPGNTEPSTSRIAPPSGTQTATEPAGSTIKVASSTVPPLPVIRTDLRNDAKPVASHVTPPSVPSSSLPEQTEARSASPAVRMLNSKRFNLNYRVSDVGPSGVSAVDLWYTRDGRAWKKHDTAPPSNAPYVVEVSEEGLYGFTLVARNGVGIGKSPPQAGDVPQVWVEVDLTKPVVHFLGAEPGYESKAQTMLIRWSATDKNLGPRPITLFYAEQAKGPWNPIAANVANNGRYVWQMPANPPSRFLLRVEGTDLAGNVASDQSAEPVLIDFSQPTVSIFGVEPTSR